VAQLAAEATVVDLRHQSAGVHRHHPEPTRGAGAGRWPMGASTGARRGRIAPRPATGMVGEAAWRPCDEARQQTQGARPWPCHPGRRHARVEAST
jgi:hypothetical protein